MDNPTCTCGSHIFTCNTPPSLLESIRHTVGPIPYTDVKVLPQGTGKVGCLTSAEQNTAVVAALTAIQQITKLVPQMPVTTSESTIMEESDGASEARSKAVPPR